MSPLCNYWHASIALQTDSGNSGTWAFQHTQKNKYKTKRPCSASPSSRLLLSETTPSRPAEPAPSRHGVSRRMPSKHVHGRPPLSIIFSCFHPWAEAKKSCVYSTNFISWGLPLLSGNSFWFIKFFLYFAKPSINRSLPAEMTLACQEHSAGRLQSCKTPFLKPTPFILLEISLEMRQGATACFKHSRGSVCSGLFWKEDVLFECH